MYQTTVPESMAKEFCCSVLTYTSVHVPSVSAFTSSTSVSNNITHSHCMYFLNRFCTVTIYLSQLFCEKGKFLGNTARRRKTAASVLLKLFNGNAKKSTSNIIVGNNSTLPHCMSFVNRCCTLSMSKVQL